jgi:ATP-dependent DNA ligase
MRSGGLNFVFELKYDGFRALAVIDRRPHVLSWNGNAFVSHADLAKLIAEHLPVTNRSPISSSRALESRSLVPHFL